METLGKALTFLLTTHPSADMELQVLYSAPPLLERALNGRGEADWVKEEQVARQLVDFAERVVPLHLHGGITAATPEVLHGALSSARRALAGYLARRGKHAESIDQFYLADEAKQEQSAAAEAAEAAATPGSGCSVSHADGARSCRRDLVALKAIAEEAMCLAHESDPDSADRSEHVSHAIRAAREALRATPAIDEKAKAKAQMLLARMLYTSLTIRTAPKSGEGQSDAVAPSNKRRVHLSSLSSTAISDEPRSRLLGRRRRSPRRYETDPSHSRCRSWSISRTCCSRCYHSLPMLIRDDCVRDFRVDGCSCRAGAAFKA